MTNGDWFLALLIFVNACTIGFNIANYRLNRRRMQRLRERYAEVGESVHSIVTKAETVGYMRGYDDGKRART